MGPSFEHSYSVIGSVGYNTYLSSHLDAEPWRTQVFPFPIYCTRFAIKKLLQVNKLLFPKEIKTVSFHVNFKLICSFRKESCLMNENNENDDIESLNIDQSLKCCSSMFSIQSFKRAKRIRNIGTSSAIE